jgi:hypothetical protein
MGMLSILTRPLRSAASALMLPNCGAHPDGARCHRLFAEDVFSCFESAREATRSESTWRRQRGAINGGNMLVYLAKTPLWVQFS